MTASRGALLRALGQLRQYTAVTKHVTAAQDFFQLEGLRVDLTAGVTGLKHAQLVDAFDDGGANRTGCAVLAGTAQGAWCLSFEEGVERSMWQLLQLPADAVTRVVGVAAVRLLHVEEQTASQNASHCAHLVLL